MMPCNHVYLIEDTKYGCREKPVWRETKVVNMSRDGSDFGWHYFYWCDKHVPMIENLKQPELDGMGFEPPSKITLITEPL